MTANFSRQTSALENVDASGDAKFNELDRNGQSAAMNYTAGDGVVRLRGGEPIVWDARARLKATEIDSDSVNKISNARGNVLTTYYSQEQTNGAAPFKSVKSPVFIASAAAEFQHETGVGVYTGNARAWQDDNFVKADRLVLRREQKRMEGDGNVQSALYQARRKEANGEREVVPVFATSRSMTYSDAERLLHYAGDVDIRQGTERITSEVSDVFLHEGELRGRAHDLAARGRRHAARASAVRATGASTPPPTRRSCSRANPRASRTPRRAPPRATAWSSTCARTASSATPAHRQQATGRVRTTHKIKKQ